MATTSRWAAKYGEHVPVRGSFINVHMTAPDLTPGVRTFIVTRAYDKEITLFYPLMLRSYTLTLTEWKRLKHSKNKQYAWTHKTCLEFLERRVTEFERNNLRFQSLAVQQAMGICKKEIEKCSPSSSS